MKNQKPYFSSNGVDWYLHERLNSYLECKQADNLDSILNMKCFIVKSKDFKDLVLIDEYQQIIKAYHN